MQMKNSHLCCILNIRIIAGHYKGQMSLKSLGSAVSKLCWNSATCMCAPPLPVYSSFSSLGSWLPTPCVVVLARVCECETHRVFVDVELCFGGTFVLSCLRLCLCSTSDKPRNYLHRGAPEGRHRAGGGQRGGQPRHAVSEGQGC